MSEQQADGSSEQTGVNAENASASSTAAGSKSQDKSASAAKSSNASASKEGGSSTASQQASKDGKSKSQASAAKSKEASASKEGSVDKKGASAESQKTSASKSKDGSAAKSKSQASASKSKEKSASKVGSTENPKVSVSKSKEASGTKSTEGSKAKSKSKSVEISKQASNQSKQSKGGSKSKEKSKSKDKTKSKQKPKSGEKSKSKKKPSEMSKSKERSKSADKSKGKSATSTASKASNKSKDIKLHKQKKVNLGGAKIGFVGAGKMTEAIVRGLLNVAKIEPKKIFVAGKTGKTLDSFKTRGINVSKRSYDIFGQFDCDIVFLCIHGHVIRSCFKAGGTRPFAFTVNYIPNQKHPLYVLSLIGGVSLSDVKATLLDPENPDKYMLQMHRVMLNIGVGYGIGMGALDVEPDSTKCSPVVRDLLSTITKLDYFPEQMMDAACSIGGNGLAFCYYFISNLADGGFKMGLNKVMAIKLAAKALQSAAQCLLESNKHPSELQDSVTSQAGPAIYGIHVMEKADCSAGFVGAIEGAFRRLKELVNVEPIAELEAKPF